MSKNFLLRIRTPEKEVFSGEVAYLKLVTEQGLIKILPGHASLSASVMLSPVVFRHLEEEDTFVVKRGILLVSHNFNTIDLMVLSCQKKHELNHVTAREYLQFIEAELKKGTDLSDFKIRYFEEEKFVVEKELGLLDEKVK